MAIAGTLCYAFMHGLPFNYENFSLALCMFGIGTILNLGWGVRLREYLNLPERV